MLGVAHGYWLGEDMEELLAQSLSGHREREEMGYVFLFVKKPAFDKKKKKKTTGPHSIALPSHPKKWTTMFIAERRITFLSIWSNLTLSACGIEWIFLLNPHPCLLVCSS